MVEHQHVAALMISNLKLFATMGLDHTCRFGQAASLAFDASIEDIYMAFSFCGTVVPMSDEVKMLGPDLPAWMHEHRVSYLDPTPTLLRMMGDVDVARDVPHLRVVQTGGEAISQHLVDRWAASDTCVLVNGYGPTEVAITCMQQRLHAGGPVVIGKPTLLCQAWVVDHTKPDLPVVPDGTQGELCISGPQVTRGYLNLPDRTAQSFVRHPVIGRTYRTGDLVCRRPVEGDTKWPEYDGSVEYLGRIDSQVKLHGLRIELGEIETCLCGIPGISDAVAAIQSNGGKHLVAFVKLDRSPPGWSSPRRAELAEAGNDQGAIHADGSLNKEWVREYMLARLPSYSVPFAHHLATLESFPTSVSGKTDVKKLPVLGNVAGVAKTGHQGAETPGKPASARPQSELEGVIASAFAQHLALSPGQQWSTEDDFFELGGTSVVAAQVISTLRQSPHTRTLSVRDLYANRSVKGVAEALTIKRGQAGGPSLLQHQPSRLSTASSATGTASVGAAARGAAVATIVAAFAEHLGVTPAEVPETADFFQLGGTSVVAAQVISTLRKHDATKTLSVRDLYNRRNAQDIASALQPTDSSRLSRGATPSQWGAGAGSLAHYPSRRDLLKAAHSSKLKREGSIRSVSATHTSAPVAVDGMRFGPEPVENCQVWVCCLLMYLWMLTAAILGGAVSLVAVDGFLTLASCYSLSLVTTLLVLGFLGSFCNLFIRLPVTLALVLLVKKVLIGKYKPGIHKVYSWWYLRHWIVQTVARALPWGAVAGTELHSVLLRMLGARVGKGVIFNRGGGLARGGWDLLTIEDGVVVNRDARIQLIEVSNMEYLVAPVVLKQGCTLQCRAAVSGDVVVGEGAVIAPLSLVGAGQQVPANELWRGVPAVRVGLAPTVAQLSEHASAPMSRWGHCVAMMTAQSMSSFLMSVPMLAAFFVAAWLDGFTVEDLHGLVAPTSSGECTMMVAGAGLSRRPLSWHTYVRAMEQEDIVMYLRLAWVLSIVGVVVGTATSPAFVRLVSHVEPGSCSWYCTRGLVFGPTCRRLCWSPLATCGVAAGSGRSGFAWLVPTSGRTVRSVASTR